MSLVRTRWAAVGAAVAVSLGAGGISLTQAAINSGDKPVFVSITPCRLIDTRGSVGTRTTPLAPGDTLTLQITGSTGNCAAIPGDAVAAAMNVTAIRGTERSFLTVYPADTTLPNASNLNWNAGDPPTPNKVDVKLSTTGAVKMTNDAGSVHVAADLVGYYIDQNHDDRYYTKTQVDALHPSAASTGVGTRCNADGTADGGPRAGQYDPCSAEISLGALSAHAVLLVAQIGWGQYQSSGPVKGACHIERNGVAIAGSEITMGETTKTTEESNAGGINNRRLNWAGVTVVSGPHSGSGTYRVACREVVGDMQFNEISLSGVVTSL